MLLPMRGKCRGLGDIWGRSKDPSYDAAFVTKINLNIEVVRDFFDPLRDFEWHCTMDKVYSQVVTSH